MLLLGGVISLVLAVAPLRSGRATAIPVPAGTAVRLPAPGLFASTLVLYGRTDGERPTDAALGCNVTAADGEDVGLKVFTLRALGAGQRVVGEETLTPVATVADFSEGFLLTCAGPAATTAQPLFLLEERRRPIPAGAIAAFGVLCLALGAGGLVVARRARGDGGSALSGA